MYQNFDLAINKMPFYVMYSLESNVVNKFTEQVGMLAYYLCTFLMLSISLTDEHFIS